jgi:hypothetical protein
LIVCPLHSQCGSTKLEPQVQRQNMLKPQTQILTSRRQIERKRKGSESQRPQIPQPGSALAGRKEKLVHIV